MGALDDIATTGSPAIVTALGMGTVFLCLMLLYLATRLTGRWLPRFLAAAGAAPSVEAVASTTGHEGAAISEARPAAAAREEGMAAAITLALARDRSSRMRSVVGESRGADSWKISGRMRALRDR